MSNKETLRLLTASESVNMPTGYGIVMNNLIKRLVKDYNWEIKHMGWQHQGMPIPFYSKDFKHKFEQVSDGLSGMTAKGFPEMMPKYIQEFKPDTVFSLIDFWYTDGMINYTKKFEVPYVNYFPVDGDPFFPGWVEYLKETHTPLAMSEYGRTVVKESVDKWAKGGWKRAFEMDVLYHGVDVDVFHPFTSEMKMQNRIGMFGELSPDKFVVGSVGKNAERKQFPRLMKAFAKFAEGKKDVCLALKVGDPADRTRQGHNLYAIASALGLTNDNLMWLDKVENLVEGVTTEKLSAFYNLFDVHALATSGEGFGIPTMEAMACGTPNVITDYTTSEELVGKRGWLIPCKAILDGQFNVGKGIVDIQKMADAFQYAYDNPKDVKKRGNESFRFAKKNFNWDVITKKCNGILRKAADDSPFDKEVE